MVVIPGTSHSTDVRGSSADATHKSIPTRRKEEITWEGKQFEMQRRNYLTKWRLITGIGKLWEPEFRDSSRSGREGKKKATKKEKKERIPRMVR